MTLRDGNNLVDWGVSPSPIITHERRYSKMFDANDTQTIRAKAALDLLRLKAGRQMCEGKTTCTLDESDIQEVLFVAGMEIKEEKKLEVM